MDSSKPSAESSSLSSTDLRVASVEIKTGWMSRFKWFSSISKEEMAHSERQVLEHGGELDFSDVKHVCLHQTFLSSSSDDDKVTEGKRIINTLIIDQEDVTSDARGRNNVVICHGFGAGLGFFYRNLSPISKTIKNSRVYAIDWLGMGRSSRPQFPMFRSDSESDVQAAINFFLDSFEEWRSRQNGLEKFVMVGHSLGGYLAALYALRYPERVQRLILVSPVGLPEQEAENTTVTGRRLPSLVTRIWNSNFTPQGLLRGLGPLGARMANGYINARFASLPLPDRQLLGRYFYHISVAPPSGEFALAAILAPGAWAREPLHHRLPDLSMPCSFIYGQHDWMDKRHAEAAMSQMREAKLYCVEGADHHLHVDNPAEFNRIISEECEMTFSRE